MKQLILILCGIAIAHCGLLSLGDNCQKQYVPDLKNIAFDPTTSKDVRPTEMLTNVLSVLRSTSLRKGSV